MKLGPFPTGAPWGSAAIQAWLDRLRQIYNNALDGHIGVGGTDQHPVFTTTVAGFVPAPGSVAGEFLRDDGTWQVPGGVADHGALTGLADDDHTQYHNDARGDLRYQPLDSDLTSIAALSTDTFGRNLLTLANATALTALVENATTAVDGLVPAPGVATGKYLKDDLTWGTPSGGGGGSGYAYFPGGWG